MTWRRTFLLTKLSVILLYSHGLYAQDPPQSADSSEWMQAGDKYRESGRFDKAVNAYRIAAGKALDLKHAAKAWYLMGQTLEAHNEPDAAMECYKNSLARFRYSETEEAIGRLLVQRTTRITTAEEIKSSLRSITRSQVVDDPSIDLFVNFDLNKDTLTASGLSQVKEIAKACADPAFAGLRFELIGHTDLRGTDPYNMDLSVRRARRVLAVLTATLGANAGRFSTKGMGKTQPLRNGTSDEDGKVNRRVELKLLPGGTGGRN